MFQDVAGFRGVFIVGRETFVVRREGWKEHAAFVSVCLTQHPYPPSLTLVESRGGTLQGSHTHSDWYSVHCTGTESSPGITVDHSKYFDSHVRIHLHVRLWSYYSSAVVTKKMLLEHIMVTMVIMALGIIYSCFAGLFFVGTLHFHTYQILKCETTVRNGLVSCQLKHMCTGLLCVFQEVKPILSIIF